MAPLRGLFVDLHLHTVCSACAEVEMIPPLIVRQAQKLGLNAIAVTDHNCAANVQAVIEAARNTGLVVLPGMEVQSREEVHLLCLFDTLEQVNTWQEIVLAALPKLENREEVFGAQYVVDACGEHLYTEDRLLATSTRLSVEEIVAGVNHLDGICLAAHVDRPSYSILANLGFIPPQLPIAGVEISPHTTRQAAIERFPELAQFGIVVNGDAHRLQEMVARTQVYVKTPTIQELRLALSGQGGRFVSRSNPNRNACFSETQITISEEQ
jgi:PHP family Zn ribbon phosphoesterase